MSAITIHCEECGTRGELVERIDVHFVQQRGGQPVIAPLAGAAIVNRVPCARCGHIREEVARLLEARA